MHTKNDIAGFPALFSDSDFPRPKTSKKKNWLLLAAFAVPVVCVLTLAH